MSTRVTPEEIAAFADGELPVEREAAMRDAMAADPELAEAWRTQQGIAQIFACAFNEKPVPEDEPAGLQARLAEVGGEKNLTELRAHLDVLRARARERFETVLPPVATES